MNAAVFTLEVALARGHESLKPYPIHCVSIVIPVYNEQESLPELLRRTTAACKQLAYEYEIILVDDGSRDKSAQLLEDAAAEDGSNVVAVILNRNYGQHAAMMAGFEQCRGEVVITLDADLQTPPEEIPRLVEQAALGYDVVATVRNNRQDSAFRRWPSRLINLAVQRSTGVAMSDYGCMLRAYRRTIVDVSLAGLGVLFAVALIVLRLAFGAQWAGGGTFVLFAVLFVFTGGQFIGMGLLGEYLGRMYSDVRARPRFFLEKVLRNQPAAPAPVVVVDGLVSSHTSTSSPSDQV